MGNKNKIITCLRVYEYVNIHQNFGRFFSKQNIMHDARSEIFDFLDFGRHFSIRQVNF